MDKERLEEELVSRGLAVPGPELDMLMELFDTYSIHARIEEVEYPAVLRAYLAGLGVGEFESFLTKDEKHRLDKLRYMLSTTKHNTSRE